MGMIAFLRGTVAESYPQRLILDVHGVGYEVIVPLSTFDRLNPLPGRELTLKTYLHVRENMQVLYGFATDAERDIFLLLIDRVSGIGPATAIAILGSLSVEQFKQAVVSGDVSGIARAKGVGKKTRLTKARRELKAMGLLGRANHLPTEMSGGQQQRVGIARAFVSSPKVIFADEPTGNLDSRTSKQVLYRMLEMSKTSHVTFVMVTHEPELAECADRIVTILDGKICSNVVQDE